MHCHLPQVPHHTTLTQMRQGVTVAVLMSYHKKSRSGRMPLFGEASNHDKVIYTTWSWGRPCREFMWYIGEFPAALLWRASCGRWRRGASFCCACRWNPFAAWKTNRLLGYDWDTGYSTCLWEGCILATPSAGLYPFKNKPPY